MGTKKGVFLALLNKLSLHLPDISDSKKKRLRDQIKLMNYSNQPVKSAQISDSVFQKGYTAGLFYKDFVF